ncbi:MAG: hypothetical protein L6408_09090 [Nanoarchaeota archaeon]|nr:hypothetical protein [Nanoarchaeota archaeon]
MILEKNASFFSLFPKFLLGCGFKDIHPFDEYEKLPDIEKISGVVKHYNNQEWDIDVIYGEKRIFLIIRSENRESVMKGINNLGQFD